MTDMQRLDVKVEASKAELDKTIQTERGEARGAFNTVKAEIGGVIGRIQAIEAAQAKVPSPPGFGAEFGADFSAKGLTGASAGSGAQQQQQQQPWRSGAQQQHQQPTTGPTFYHVGDPAGSEGAAGRPKTLYDEKVAQTPANQYNEQHPEKWLEWTRGYLVGRRWEMENLLKWAEKWAKTSIPQKKVAELRQSFCHDDGFDLVQADRDLWSFLNLNVTGMKAEGKFRTVKRLRGLEAWRVIVDPIEPKTLHQAPRAAQAGSPSSPMQEAVQGRAGQYRLGEESGRLLRMWRSGSRGPGAMHDHPRPLAGRHPVDLDDGVGRIRK